MRGNHAGPDIEKHFPGSIPACAGEPYLLPFARLSHAVYPRVCGGTYSVSARAFAPYGLSPRVRGNRHERNCLARFAINRGSIPACAGEPNG